MTSITGIWGRLPDSGKKPVVVEECERMEQTIQNLKRALKDAEQKHKEHLRSAMQRISQQWTKEEIGRALAPDNYTLADYLPGGSKT